MHFWYNYYVQFLNSRWNTASSWQSMVQNMSYYTWNTSSTKKRTSQEYFNTFYAIMNLFNNLVFRQTCRIPMEAPMSQSLADLKVF